MTLEKPKIDWAKPVQWMNGDPCTAEHVDGFIIVTLQDSYPPEILDLLTNMHFKGQLVVHEDTGVPMTGLGNYAPNAWVENVEKQLSPWHEIEGIF